MSDNSEMVDAKECPLAAVIDDSCTVEYIEITPLDRPPDESSLWLSAADDCYKQECIDPILVLKPEDLQEVKQQPADKTVNVANMQEIIAPLDRPSDDRSLWLSTADNCHQLEGIEPLFVLKPEDLQDVITTLDRPSDDSSLWLSAAGDCYQLGSIEPVVEVKPEDLRDVKQEPADETDNEAIISHYAVNVRFS